MAEKQISWQKLLNIEMKKLVGKLKTIATAETTAVSPKPLLKPNLSTSSSKLSKNKQKRLKIMTGNCILFNR